MNETAELMARILMDSGMNIFSFDPEKAQVILKNTQPTVPDCDNFDKLSFNVFLELMRLEVKNK